MPTLLYTFALTENISLQNMLLELILRCFNQRSNLVRNLKSVNLFATKDEADIFEFFTNMIVKLRACVQTSDNFLTVMPQENSLKLARNFRVQIANLTIGLLKGSRVAEEDKILFDSTTELTLSANRQSMMNNLRIHEIIVSFIQKKFSMVERIVESDLGPEYKREILLLFQDCYNYLIFFCKENFDNQCLLYSKIEEFLGNMKYELGQIDLIFTVG